MAQNFINFFSWVDIDGICYIVKIVTKYDDLYFFLKHTVSNYNDAELD